MIEVDIAAAGMVDLVFKCVSQTLDNKVEMRRNKHDWSKRTTSYPLTLFFRSGVDFC